MIIRQANKEDIKRITELWRELMDLHNDYDDFYQVKDGGENEFMTYLEININDIGLFVAEINDKIAGFINCEIRRKPPCFDDRDFGMITDISISPEYRNRMIGYLLHEKAIEWFRLNGISRVEVNAHIQNKAAKSFWESAGFQTYLEVKYKTI